MSATNASAQETVFSPDEKIAELTIADALQIRKTTAKTLNSFYLGLLNFKYICLCGRIKTIQGSGYVKKMRVEDSTGSIICVVSCKRKPIVEKHISRKMGVLQRFEGWETSDEPYFLTYMDIELVKLQERFQSTTHNDNIQEGNVVLMHAVPVIGDNGAVACHAIKMSLICHKGEKYMRDFLKRAEELKLKYSF